ncbi:MAG: S41 family peptidase, partial [Lachnospiraceae bacterium]|nr:S41 family peptidase [Lachnospiraceae bacterium]
KEETFSPGRGRVLAGGILLGLLLGVMLSAGLFLFLKDMSVLLPQQGYGIGGGAEGSAVNEGSESKLKLLEEYIHNHYYHAEEITTAQKEDGMYKGLVEAIGDPYSAYYNEKEYRELNEETTGEYYGIGCYVMLREEDQATVVTGVIRESPAEEAGLLPGDVIFKVDGENAIGLSLDEVVSRIKGEEGTTVQLTVYREKESEYPEFTVRRARIESQTVYSEMKEGNIGYIELTEFDIVSTEQFKTHLNDLLEKGAEGIILDLRYNLGGNVSTVTEIAGLLLPKGLVFYVEHQDGSRTEYTCDGTDFDLPLVVLVNEYSASASEILAGAVQDAEVGTLVGTQTYGKGVMQTIFPFGDGTAVKLTVANYFTRGGRNIDQVGITPDVIAELDEEAYEEDETDTQLDKAIEVLQEKMK